MDFRCRDYLTRPARLLKLRAWMNRTPKWPAAKMETWSLNRLREIATGAAENIPYYRELFARVGFKPEGLSNFDYWRRLPVLDKDTVRLAGDRLHAANSRKLGAVQCATSGSTGTAMTFLLDREVNAASFALFWRVWNESPAWHIGRRQASLSGYAKGEWEYQRPTRILALSSFHLTRENARHFHGLISRYKPAFLRGYPSALYLFARFLEEENLQLRFPVVFTGAESLLPFQRRLIEQHVCMPSGGSLFALGTLRVDLPVQIRQLSCPQRLRLPRDRRFGRHARRTGQPGPIGRHRSAQSSDAACALRHSRSGNLVGEARLPLRKQLPRHRQDRGENRRRVPDTVGPSGRPPGRRLQA